MNWRDCDHKWMKKGDVGSEFLGIGNASYQWQCSKCKIYSYAGNLYNELPDKSKSVFLYGGSNAKTSNNR
jgi:hypothetical protein